MGRTRSADNHLPRWMYKKAASYYLVRDNKWVNLGRDYEDALIQYARLTSDQRPINTIADLIDDFVSELKARAHPDYLGLSDYTINDYCKHSKRFKLIFGKMKPEQLKRSHVYQYRDLRKSAPVQCNREISSLQKLMEHGILKGMLEENPARNVRKYPEHHRRRRPTNDDVDAFKKVACERIRAYIDLKDLTGLRQGDMLSLQWANMNDEGLLVTISKPRKDRVIFEMTSALKSALDRLKQIQVDEGLDSPFIVCNRSGNPYTESGFRSQWHKTRKKAIEAGVLTESFTEHDLRAKVASDADSDERAKELLRHSDIRVTKKYRRDVPIVRPAR